MKQKLWKKIVSILLVLCMILPVMPANPVTVKAAEGAAEDTITVSYLETKYDGKILPKGVTYGTYFASGMSAGNSAVTDKTTAGWYWDGNGNFYMTNCTLKLTGNNTVLYSKNYFLLLFGTADLTVHLSGKNTIIIHDTLMAAQNFLFGTSSADSNNGKCPYDIVGDSKSADSLSVETGGGVTFSDNINKMMYFYFRNMTNCTLVCNDSNVNVDFQLEGAITSSNAIINGNSSRYRSVGTLQKDMDESSSIQVYNHQGVADKPRTSYFIISGTTTAGERVITNGQLYTFSSGNMTPGADVSGKTITEALTISGSNYIYVMPKDLTKPLIIGRGGPDYYDLTCNAGSGVVSMEGVSYTHDEVEGGEQTPEETDGKYSIPENARVTVNATLKNGAKFQTCTGLPSDAQVTEHTDGTVTITFTMPSAAKSITAYGYSGVSAKGSAVVQKSATLDPCAAMVNLSGNTEARTVTLVRDGEEPLLLTKDGENVTDYKADLPQNSKEYKVYVDGADSGKTIRLSSATASATVTYQTYTITATKDGEAYNNPGTIQLKAGESFVTNGSNLPQGKYDIYLNGERVSDTAALSDSTLKFYTVTFNNGANQNPVNYGENTSFCPQVVLSGKTAAEPEVTPDAPEGMETMLFAGWTKDSAAFDFATAITAATTLTAKWITEEAMAADPAIEAKWTIDGESSYGLLSDALAATKTAGRGQILLLNDSVALKEESENELAANVTLTVPEGKAITDAQSLTAKGTIINKGTISCPVTNSGSITNSGSLASVTNLSGAKITNTGTITSADNAGSITGGVITTASNTGTIKGAKVGINTSTGTLDGCTITSGTGINGTVKGYTYAADAVTFATNADTQGTINIGGDTTYRTLIKAQNEAGTEKALKVNIITRSTLTESGTLDLDGHSIKGADGNSTAKDGVTPLTANADLTVTGTGSITGGIGYSAEEAGNGGHGIAGNGHNIVIDANVTVTGGIGGAGIEGAAKGGQGGCGVHMGAHSSESTTGTATIAGTVIGGRGGAAVENGICGKGGYGVCGTDIVDNGGEYQPGKGGDGRTSDPTNNTLTPPQNGEEGKGTENPVKYGITYDLDRIVIDGEQPDVVLDGSGLTLTLKAADDVADNPYLVLPSNIEVTMGGSALTPEQYTYNQETHALTIESVSGAVTITAAMQKVEEIEVNNATKLRNALEAGISKIIVTEDIVLDERDAENKLLPLEIPEGITVSVSEGKVIDLAQSPYSNKGTIAGKGAVVRSLRGQLIKHDGTAVSNAGVTLKQGAKEIATATTDAGGNYCFQYPEGGNYNVVFTLEGDRKFSDYIEHPMESEKEVKPPITKLPDGIFSTEVEVKESIPQVSVGDLDTLFEEAPKAEDDAHGITQSDTENGKSVALKMTVDEVPAQNLEQAMEIGKKVSEDSSDASRKFVFMDISVTKTVTPAGDHAEGVTTKLVETNALIKVCIPLEGKLAGKTNYVLYRYHTDAGQEEGSVEQIQEGEEYKNSDGEYITVDDTRGYMYAFLKKFSTYGIGYETPGGESGTNYHILYELSGLVSDGTDSVEEDASLQVTLALEPEHNPYLMLPDTVVVTMGGTPLTESSYSYSKESGRVYIPNVTGDVKITAAAVPKAEAEVDSEAELRKALEAGVPQITVTETIELSQTDEDSRPLMLTIPEGVTVTVQEGKVLDLAQCPYRKTGSVAPGSKVVRTLYGKLIDHRSSAVAGATVTLQQGTTELAAATTDANGAYCFKNLEAGNYDVVFKITSGSGVRKYTDSTEHVIETENAAGLLVTQLPAENTGGSGGAAVTIPVSRIELSSSAKTLTRKGETLQINAAMTPHNATDKKLIWSSSDNSVATVDENGKVTAVSDGTVTITAKSHNGVTAEITIVVKLEKEQTTDDGKEDNKDPDKENVTDKDKTDTTEITPDNTFRKLRLRSSKVTRNSSTLVWNRVKEADGYIVYGAQCNSNGKVYKIKKIATIKDNSTVTYKAKALKSGTYYKYCVAAYKLVNKKQTIIAKSKVIHVATSSGKYGNYKAVKVNKAKVELKAGKTYTIKATQVKEKKPVKKHADIHFETSNSKIAAVNKKGVITAKQKGTCTIYVYAQNGIYKTVKVIVK